MRNFSGFHGLFRVLRMPMKDCWELFFSVASEINYCSTVFSSIRLSETSNLSGVTLALYLIMGGLKESTFGEALSNCKGEHGFSILWSNFSPIVNWCARFRLRCCCCCSLLREWSASLVWETDREVIFWEDPLKTRIEEGLFSAGSCSRKSM